MFKRILALVKKELLTIWRDPKSRTLVVLPPVMQLFIFAYAMTMEIKNIDLAILDRAQTYESREFLANFSSSKWFRKLTYVNNEKELAYLISVQKAQIGIEIPNDFSKNIKRKKAAKIQVITDGRQTNSAAVGGNYVTTIVENYNTTLGKNNGAALAFDIRSFYNPNLDYIYYTLVSLMVILAMVITLLLTSLSIARERELGTFDQLIVSPSTPFEILLGKTIAPMLVAIILTFIIVLIAITYFKVPFRGSVWLFLISTIFALLSITGVGLFISSLCKTQQQAILGAFTFQTPASLLSGFISPIEDMPKVFQYITLADPLRFYLKIGKGLFLKDIGAADVFYNVYPLMIIAAITLFAAYFQFKRQLD